MLAATGGLHVLRGISAGEILFLRGIREARRVGGARAIGSAVSWPLACAAVILADAELLMISLLAAEAVSLLRLLPLSARVLAPAEVTQPSGSGVLP